MTGPVRKLVSLILLASTLTNPVSAAGMLPGTVLRVLDGDSLVLDVRGSHYRIDLAGIDAPELDQPWGGAARDSLARTLTGRFVVAQPVRYGPRGRIQGRLAFKKQDLGLNLLRSGLAWCIPQPEKPYATRYQQHLDAQTRARSARLGLWSDDSPVPPWEWRARRAGAPN